MRDEKTRRKKRGAVNALALGFVVAAIYIGARVYVGVKAPAQVRFVESAAAETKRDGDVPANAEPPEIFAGELYATTERLRECGAVGMAMSLGVFAAARERGTFPEDLAPVWRHIGMSKLLPPGVAVESGELASAKSRFHVRYRSEPFAIEVVGEPLAARGEPAIIVRLPIPSADGRTIAYFQSSSAGSASIPPPFESPARLVASGWSLRQWRGEILPNGPDAAALESERLALRELAGGRQ